MFWEFVDIELHPNTTREDGLYLSKQWKSLVYSLEGRINPQLQE
jgi:hypothetical protein